MDKQRNCSFIVEIDAAMPSPVNRTSYTEANYEVRTFPSKGVNGQGKTIQRNTTVEKTASSSSSSSSTSWNDYYKKKFRRLAGRSGCCGVRSFVRSLPTELMQSPGNV